MAGSTRGRMLLVLHPVQVLARFNVGAIFGRVQEPRRLKGRARLGAARAIAHNLVLISTRREALEAPKG